jgi:hypothetical protein
VLIFPEGTDLSAKNKARSNEFALKNGLPAYSHILHPRTKGFAASLQGLRAARNSVRTVFDVTLAYSGHVPQNEAQLVAGRMPSAMHVYVRAIDAQSLPSDDAGVEAWVTARFAEKERLLAHFQDGGRVALTPTGAPDMAEFERHLVRRSATVPWLRYAACALVIAAVAALVAGLCTAYPRAALAYVVAQALAYALVIPKAFGGLDKLELRLHNTRPLSPLLSPAAAAAAGAGARAAERTAATAAEAAAATAGGSHAHAE